jgi:LysM repeat protein
VNCYTCDNSAENACKRCANPYCAEHGDAQYCANCLQPASALPSFNLYRGSLLALLIGTALAVFLLVRPPGATEGGPVTVGGAVATPTVEATPGATEAPHETPATTPAVTATPAPERTPTPAPTETPEPPAPFLEHVVQEGDSLFGIAQQYLPPGDDLGAFVQAIANLNGLDPDGPLSVGQTILLPNPQ